MLPRLGIDRKPPNRDPGCARRAAGLRLGLPWLAVAFGAWALLAGCASPGRQKPLLEAAPGAKRWPPPPAEARIRYLGAFASARDLGARPGLWERIVGEEPAERLVAPTDVAVAGDNLVFVIDRDVPAVHRFDLAAREHDILGAGRLEVPAALCWTGDRLLIADAGAGAILAWSGGAGMTRFDRDAPGRPAGLAFVPESGRLYVSDLAEGAILAYDAEGRRTGILDAGEVSLGAPTHLAYHPATGLVVSDALAGRLVRLDPDGRLLGTIGAPGDAPGDLALPKGVAVDSQGNIYVVDARFENVQLFDADGHLLMAFGQEGSGEGEFWLPAGLCIDPRDRIWVADTYNCRVQVFEFLGVASDANQEAVQN